MNIFIEEHRQLLHLLVKNNVDFILIGGYAVIHYGYERTTGDMDIWLKTGNTNRDKLIKALKAFGIIDTYLYSLGTMDFTDPQPLFFIGQKPKRIDFITLISNISFDDAIKEVNHVEFDNISIPVIHYNHLILSKLTTGRLKDQADIEELQRINKYKK